MCYVHVLLTPKRRSFSFSFLFFFSIHVQCLCYMGQQAQAHAARNMYALVIAPSHCWLCKSGSMQPATDAGKLQYRPFQAIPTQCSSALLCNTANEGPLNKGSAVHWVVAPVRLNASLNIAVLRGSRMHGGAAQGVCEGMCGRMGEGRGRFQTQHMWGNTENLGKKPVLAVHRSIPNSKGFWKASQTGDQQSHEGHDGVL